MSDPVLPTAALFLHANGYPTGAYRQFILALSQQLPVDAPEVIETPLLTSASDRWPVMLQLVQRMLEDRKDPVHMVGHSMGGYLSLMAAASHPDKVKSIVLIDSPVVTGWRGLVWSTMLSLGVTNRGGPSPIAARRRFEWDDRTTAREFFESKSFVRRWANGILEDFVEHALVQPDPDKSRVVLRIPREAERDIYAQLPARRAANSYRSIREQIPVSVISGTQSREFDLGGRASNQRLFGSAFHSIQAGHLIPMERPQECAELTVRCLNSRY